MIDPSPSHSEKSDLSANPKEQKLHSLWQLGFRPFFLLGSALGAISLTIWLWALKSASTANQINSFWHAHEMMHGFVVAIIIGFLYTASQNWTGIRGIHGTKLKGLTLLWVIGRISFLLPDASFLTGIDLLFLPIASGFLASFLLKSDQKKNLIFLVLLALLWFSDLIYHFQPDKARLALYFAIHIVIIMITVIGGRVIPFFSQKAIIGYKRRQIRFLDLASIISAFFYAVSQYWNDTSILTFFLALLAGTLNLLRLGAWYNKQIWKKPILWILFVSYFWLVIGFYLSALAAISKIPFSIALHAFTAGTISAMIIGMISRVSLGHTGREIKASHLTVAAYICVLIAALLRVFAALALPNYYLEIMLTAGIFWILSFLIFLFVYAPMLLSPRIDGREG